MNIKQYNQKHSKKLIIVCLYLAFIIQSLLGLAQTINVQSVSTARQTGGDNGYTLNGQWMVDSRSKLLNPSNFGPGGTYPKTINITDGYSTTGSLTQISTVPTNAILFFGVFNLNDASTQPFTDAEIDSVYNWSIKGGKMIICADPNLLPTINYAILNAKWGFSLTPTSSVSLFPTPAGNASIIFNGPFGNVPSASEGGSLQGFFNSIPSNSIVLAREAYGNPTLYLDCNTLDLLAADVDVYSTLGGISTGNMINNNEDKFLANVFAYMDTMQDPPTIIKNGINLSCTSVYSKYQWYLNGDSITSATNQTYTVAQNGTYTVKAYLNCGCKVFSNEIAIDTSFLEDVLIIPNVFDPNNPDPVNQTFHVIGTGIKTLDFIVYDRWGEKVFETNDVNKGWEGTLDGEKLSTAVFVYYVKATFNDGKEIEKKGNVTLIR